jgi:hypothetical protein
MFFKLKGAHTYFNHAYMQVQNGFPLRTREMHLSFESLVVIDTLRL